MILIGTYRTVLRVINTSIYRALRFHSFTFSLCESFFFPNHLEDRRLAHLSSLLPAMQGRNVGQFAVGAGDDEF